MMETDVYTIVRTVAISCSAAVSFASAIIAFTAVMGQRNALKHSANLERLTKATDLIPHDPELLRLHGICQPELRADGISETELIYLIYLFEAGDLYYTIEGSKNVELRPYRKAMLNQPKVRLIWQKYLNNRLFHRSPFTDAVNQYIDEYYPQ